MTQPKCWGSPPISQLQPPPGMQAGDALRASSWAKHPQPVFQRENELGIFGPGHNSFTRGIDGSWCVWQGQQACCVGKQAASSSNGPATSCSRLLPVPGVDRCAGY